MANLKDIHSLGIDPCWPSRQTVVRWIEATTPWSMEQADAYNRRTDVKNVRNTLPTSSYDPVGFRQSGKATALALEGKPWESAMASALGYQLFGDKLKFFWHGQFRMLFPSHQQPLRMMNWSVMTETMAMAFVLGWEAEGIYQGYLTHAALLQSYQLKESYESHHRRGHALMLRLFEEWRGDVSHIWPAFAYEQPIYEQLLKLWKEPDPEALVPSLIAACDLHTHEALPDTEEVFHDFSNTPRTPLEILFLYRLRALSGLINPVLNHPLMEAPFDRLPEAQPPYKPDDLMLGTLTRVHEDWPGFDAAVSLGAVKDATMPGM